MTLRVIVAIYRVFVVKSKIFHISCTYSLNPAFQSCFISDHMRPADHNKNTQGYAGYYLVVLSKGK